MMTLTAYAKHRGVTKMAVSKAVASGRLLRCIVRDAQGRPSITDAALADEEWNASKRVTPVDRDINPAIPPPAGVPPLATSVAIKEAAAARVLVARAELAEHEVAKRRGSLIDAVKAKQDLIAKLAIVKMRFLGLSSKFASQNPQYVALVPVIDGLVREALEDLASA